MRKMHRSGFTLIEMLIVVAIIAIVGTLAVQKFSGVKEEAQAKVNFANLKRVHAAIDAYSVANALDNARTSTIFNYLDALVMQDAPDGTPGGTGNLKDVADNLLVYTNAENRAENTGLSAALASDALANPYAEKMAVLGTYYLSEADAAALTDFGLKYVLRGYPERTSVARQAEGEDGAWIQGSAKNPDTCSCWAVTNRSGRAVAVVNPGASAGDVPVGVDIYRSLGEDVLYSGRGKLLVKGVTMADNEAAFKALLDGEGVLVAFGLGEKAALIGSEKAGLDSAPVSPVMKKDEYRRYIVLLRLRHIGGTSKVSFAGVMDPTGKTLSMLREAR